MIKKVETKYSGMSKDISRDIQKEKYFDARNIRILASSDNTSFALTNEKGTKSIFSIPKPILNLSDTTIEYEVLGEIKSVEYKREEAVIPGCEIESDYFDISSVLNGGIFPSGEQKIIGVKEMRNSAIIVSTDNNGYDCIWELTGLDDQDFNIELLYLRDLGLSTDYPVQIIFNYENSVIQKIYLVDGIHQIRYLNIRQSVDNGDLLNLIDVKSTSIDFVSTFDLSQPSVVSVNSGGSHTSGMVQYAYNLYVLNGAQTSISPISELTSIDKGLSLGGGDVNENLGMSVNIRVDNVDEDFTNIRLYSIKYTAYNQIPEVKIIADREIDGFSDFNFTDTGVGGESISLEEFLFLGSNPIIPKHIESKDSRLFAFNIKESSFDIDLDCRAFSFSSSGKSRIMDNTFLNQDGSVNSSTDVYLQMENGGTTATSVNKPLYNVPERFDCVNYDYETYKYTVDGSNFGGSGKYLDVILDQVSLLESESRDRKLFKDREIYRLGIKFYNRRGQSSLPKWIIDIKSLSGNLEGNHVELKVKFNQEFYDWLNDDSNFNSKDDKPIGYKILRADRKLSDQTILTQGMINPTVANYASRNKTSNIDSVKDIVNSSETVKMPSAVRTFETVSPFVQCHDYCNLSYENITGPYAMSKKTESYKASTSEDFAAETFQHSRLMQMFSPESTFSNIYIDSSYKLRVLGLATESKINNWSKEIDVVTGNPFQESKFNNGINDDTIGVTKEEIIGSSSNLMDRGLWGSTNGENSQPFHQFYREFLGDFKYGNPKDYNMYGSPEVTEIGADYKSYNNDFNLRYCNHLKDMLQDSHRNSDHVSDKAHIRGVNSVGGKCITFVEGPNDPSYNLAARKSIEQMRDGLNTVSEKNGILIAEFSKDNSQLYVGNMYGGTSFESKRNSDYIEIGDYSDINSNTLTIKSPGDTFVGDFTFTKLAKDNVEISSVDYVVACEIVTIKVETTIDVKNRNDLSIGEWDNRWQPRYEEYQKYNYVYSQQPTLAISSDIGFKFKKIKEFDTRITTTKSKIPGEFIDSWTDFLENENLDLDGEYGPINGSVNFNDNIYCFQDRSLSLISINPRVQTQGNDGFSIELGTGGILHDYRYISTRTGTINKWSIVSTDLGFYFVDLVNKNISMCNGNKVISLTDVNGFHSEMQNSLDRETLSIDNPVINKGVSVGYDQVNKNIYFTFAQENSFTLGYNENINSFVCYHDYIPPWFINKGDTMISVGTEGELLHSHFNGLPNHYHDQHFRSEITFHIAPQGNEIIMNGAEYKMELTKDNLEVPNEGLTMIQSYNDYQDSGEVPLVLRSNMYKKFKNWKVNFPRNKNTRDRVRGAWGFAKFIFDNPEGRDLVLYNITIFYTQH